MWDGRSEESKIMSPSVRTDDMGNWNVITRNCPTLEQAMTLAQEALLRTPKVLLWPITAQHWLVVIQTPVFAN